MSAHGTFTAAAGTFTSILTGSIAVDVWGGGGGGAGGDGLAWGGAAGGGGAYSGGSNLSVTAGGTYLVVVGAGGGGGTQTLNGTIGGSSYFIGTSTLYAVGGAGGTAGSTVSSGGAGGTSTSGVGNVKYSGGNGGSAATAAGGGGGGGAGNASNGGPGGGATTAVQGTSGTGGNAFGGAGGIGGTVGTVIGGAGGGAASSVLSGRNGARGQVSVTYENYPTYDTTGQLGSISGAGSTISVTHTISGTNTLQVVLVMGRINGTMGSVTNLKFAGTSLTRAGFVRLGNPMIAEAWYLANPPIGLGTLNGTVSIINQAWRFVPVSFYNMSGTPLDNMGSAIGTSATVATTLTPSEGSCVLLDMVIHEASDAGTMVNNYPMRNQLRNVDEGAFSTSASFYIQGTAATAGTMSWNEAASDSYAHFIASFKAAPGGAPPPAPSIVSWKSLLGVGQG